MTTKAKEYSDLFLEQLVIDLEKKGLASFQDSLLATGSPSIATKEATRFLEGSAFFEIDCEGTFEATVDAKDGLRYFSGVDAEGVSSNASATCRALDNQIRRAFAAMRPESALETIGVVWDMAERTCELAAARSRLLLGKLPQLEQAETPDWFTNSEANWDSEDRRLLNPSSLSSSIRIVETVAKAFPMLRAEVTVGMLGRVTFDWQNVSERCVWMIDPTDLPFPSIRVYEAREGSDGRIKTRIIHNMYQALKTLKGLVIE